MNGEWTENMKQKLEGHRKTPPTGLWESISSEMGLQNEPVPQTVAIKRWPWAVVAVVLALVVFFVTYLFDQSEPLPRVAQVIHTTETPHTSLEPTTSMTEEVCAKKQRRALVAEPIQEMTEEPTREESIVEIPQQEIVAEQPRQEIAEESPQQTIMVTSHPTHSETDYHATAHYHAKQTVTSGAEGKWSIGLNASGGLLASSDQSRTDRIYNRGEYADFINTNDATINEQYSYTKTNVVAKHRPPIRIGLSVQYQLNEKMALLSGINYTFLYSEFYEQLYNSISYTQKLSYLGIPLGISWQLWKMGHFSLYVSGQAMLEKCLNDKPWQWSLGASLGAEYGITRQLGLYLEPSLGYFFNDGTQLEHYYKEHPFAPSIEFGLRVYLNK